MILYDDHIDKKATISKAKRVLRDYKKILKYLDEEIYAAQLRSSWNIGMPINEHHDISMVERMNKLEKKYALQYKIINDVQLAINKLESDEIRILYLIYLKELKPMQIEDELHISERQRCRLSNTAHLSFARAYNIEIMKAETERIFKEMSDFIKSK